MQEDKILVFDTTDTVKACLTVLAQMFPEIKFNKGKMYGAAEKAYSTTADIAEYLVKKRIPFREAHEITGKIVLYCIKIKELKGFPSMSSKILFSYCKRHLLPHQGHGIP